MLGVLKTYDWIIEKLQVGSLHSQISQQERTSSLTKFRSGRIKILICTDVASRGLDIPHVNFCHWFICKGSYLDDRFTKISIL